MTHPQARMDAARQASYGNRRTALIVRLLETAQPLSESNRYAIAQALAECRRQVPYVAGQAAAPDVSVRGRGVPTKDTAHDTGPAVWLCAGCGRPVFRGTHAWQHYDGSLTCPDLLGNSEPVPFIPTESETP